MIFPNLNRKHLKMTTTITLYRVTHGNQNVLLAKFAYNKKIYSTILNSRLGYWDKYHRGMILTNRPNILVDFKKLMTGIAEINENHLYSTTKLKEKLRSLNHISNNKGIATTLLIHMQTV